VTLLANHPRIMPREDPAAARLVEAQMVRDGVRIVYECQVLAAEKQGAEKVLYVEQKGQGVEVRVDAVLSGVGRTPNVDGLDLDKAGVEFTAKEGVKVGDRLQTSNPRIFAAGDICSRFQFTHAADAMARIAIQNALFFGRAKASALTIPWCTYTDPEVAHVGLYEDEAKAQGIPIQTFTQEMAHVDRAILDGDTDGFVKVHVRGGTDTIVGATIVARHAGEMISELTLAMVGRLGLSTLAKTIHPYPTQAEAIKRVADAYNRTRLMPRVKRLFERWLAWRR
jgi:pyruvate/2-oxoglutarate dehydrogenase complex dihydrolipoamide dehydrogenase (E3) component